VLLIRNGLEVLIIHIQRGSFVPVLAVDWVFILDVDCWLFA
jgi:hypothetical protein